MLTFEDLFNRILVEIIFLLVQTGIKAYSNLNFLFKRAHASVFISIVVLDSDSEAWTPSIKNLEAHPVFNIILKNCLGLLLFFNHPFMYSGQVTGFYTDIVCVPPPTTWKGAGFLNFKQ